MRAGGIVTFLYDKSEDDGLAILVSLMELGFSKSLWVLREAGFGALRNETAAPSRS